MARVPGPPPVLVSHEPKLRQCTQKPLGTSRLQPARLGDAGGGGGQRLEDPELDGGADCLRPPEAGEIVGQSRELALQRRSQLHDAHRPHWKLPHQAKRAV